MGLFDIFKMQKKSIEYTFVLKENVYMYNHLMTCTDNENVYEAICEDAPTKERTLIFWIDDFDLPEHKKEKFTNELKNWCSMKGFHCMIHQGHGR